MCHQQTFADLSDIPASEDNLFSVSEIQCAIRKLKKGKSAGLDGLTSEHICYAHPKLSVFFHLVFNSMMIHGTVPEKLMDTKLISIIKDKKGIITDKDNYRPIAITSATSKVLELIILDKYSAFLETNCHQFGFKHGHSTDQCIFVMKEVISYYNVLSSPIYACFIDASKAFDRVNHWHLFDKLLNRKMPKLAVRLLMVWYVTQTFVVKWDNVVSDKFTVINGVRQGGVLSPKLFNIYIEGLSEKLVALRIGCQMNNQFINHLNYADDAVLLAPTPSALQLLINVCDDFAKQNDMLYNVKKSLCSAFIPKLYGKLHIPSVFLGTTPLKWVSQYKYLGSIIDCTSNDDADICRQIQAIYARGNILIRNFRKCSEDVKVELFKSYCTNMYGSHLWNSYSVAMYRRINVAYNNIFRILMGVRRGDSISQAFVSANVNGFKPLIRKSIYCFYERLMKCENVLVNTIVSSAYFVYQSALFTKWKQLLFKF